MSWGQFVFAILFAIGCLIAVIAMIAIAIRDRRRRYDATAAMRLQGALRAAQIRRQEAAAVQAMQNLTRQTLQEIIKESQQE